MTVKPPFQPPLWTSDPPRPPAALPTALSTGFAALDAALCAGGFAPRRLTALWGMPTSGATTCAYRAIAGADGGTVYLDLAATFDPEAAARCGVILAHVLVARSSSLASGLALCRDLLLAGSARLLVIDLDGLTDGVSAAHWTRLADAARRSESALLALRDRPDPGLLAAAQTALTFERRGWLVEDGRVRGCRTQVRIEKDKPRVQTASVLLDIAMETVG